MSAQEAPGDEISVYQDPLKGGVRTTNLVVDSQYVQSWKSCHAFRELYQNWNDAIKERNRIYGDFIIRREDNDDHIIFLAIHPNHSGPDPGHQHELGFIKYSKTNGTIELTNYDASLSGKSLGIGESSKAGKSHLAGHHGEGYKVAALVFLRDGCLTTIHASKCEWTFFDAQKGEKNEGELCVKPKPRSKQRLDEQRAAQARRAQQGTPRPRKGFIWKDVTFFIGGHEERRVSSNTFLEGRKVSEEEFLEWTKFALELNPPSRNSRYETSWGSLILDPAFGNKMFLKGILLDESSFDGAPFKYGYNLFEGCVDRDRKRLSNQREQPQILAQIWSEAIEEDDSHLSLYVDMLQTAPTPTAPVPADVLFAHRLMTRNTAFKIWRYLSTRDPERKDFYYDCRRQQEVAIITNSLQRNPVQLQPSIWDSLRKHDLVRTPQEHQTHLFEHAPIAANLDIVYSTGVKRALRAALTLDPKAAGLDLIFKWLDFRASHDRSACWLSQHIKGGETGLEHFSCYHVVTYWFDKILEELKRHSHLPELVGSHSSGLLSQRLTDKLRQMPLMITAHATETPGGIQVSWTDSEGDLHFRLYGLDGKYRVTLHRQSTCAAEINAIVSSGKHIQSSLELKERTLTTTNPEDAISPAPMSPGDDWLIIITNCGCPKIIVDQRDHKATFAGLDAEEEYFPMISRTEFQSFFGLAPSAVRPLAPLAVASPTTMHVGPFSPARHAARSPLLGNDGIQDDGDSSSDEDPPEFDHEDRLGSEAASTTREARLEQEIHTRSQAQGRVEAALTEITSLQAQLETTIQEKVNLEERATIAEAESALVQSQLKDNLEAKQREIHTLQQQEQDASLAIDTLRRQVQQHEDANEELKASLEAAEEDYETVVMLAGKAAERRQREKRGRNEGDNNDATIKTEGSASKRQRIVITTAQDGVVDLTGNNPQPREEI
ncbi:uncharacterized protein PAC_14995 [Phialocephala subalpina]|uniref:Uncharacterized protein n=1 Tax=Phialocephala subalpina TaxID=576137 RepID=A0A1L7XJ68_9HELO|nr:uncharacterized protein PAC_14995 [Phialocephala subalpina]